MTRLNVRITFLDEVLGTSPNTEDIYREFIGSKSPDASTVDDEVASLGVDEVVEKGMTVFPRTKEGVPYIYDYQVKGFFKDACSMLSRLSEKGADGKKKPANESSKLTAHKKVIDGLIFVEPRQIPFSFAGEIGSCQRPLRAQTAQGERIALANSETVPEGSEIEFTIVCMSDSHVSAVREWLDYGSFRGIGQWRNSGKGKFKWVEV